MPKSTRIGPIGVSYRSPGPAAHRRSLSWTSHGSSPHIAAIDEQDTTQFASDPEPRFGGHLHHRPAADRLPCGAQRADLIASPAAYAARAAYEIPLVKRNLGRVGPGKRTGSNAVRPHEFGVISR